MRRVTSRQRRRYIVFPAVLAIGLATLTTPAAASHEASSAAARRTSRSSTFGSTAATTTVAGSRRPDPILSWRMRATPSAGSHPCPRSGPEVACPADEQTAYQIQAANSVPELNQGNLIWDSGSVAGSEAFRRRTPARCSAHGSRSSGGSTCGTPTASPLAGASPVCGRWGCSGRATGGTPA